MNYLKMFPNILLLLSALVFTACVSRGLPVGLSESDTKIPEKREVQENITLIPEEKEVESKLPQSSMDYSEIITESVKVDQMEWSSPEPAGVLPEAVLPVVKIREVVREAPEVIFSKKVPGDIETVIIPEFIEKSDEITDSSLDVGVVVSAELNNRGSAASLTVPKSSDRVTLQNITERNLTTVSNSEVEITLSGRGWTYLPSEEGGIEYKGRKFLSDNTVYTFSAVGEGERTLEFQYQDLANNIFRREIVSLTIIPEGASGKEKISAQDLPSEPEAEVLSLIQQVEEYLGEDNMEGLSGIAEDIIKSDLPALELLVPEIADRFYKGLYLEESAILIETFFSKSGYNNSSDYFLYILGKIYESDTPLRDERISAGYYKKLIDEYPGSLYWDESQNRYRFLKRRYIDIR